MIKKKYKKPWIPLKKRILKNNPQQIVELLDSISTPDRARALFRLDKDECAQMFSLISPLEAANALEDLTDDQIAELIEGLPAAITADIFDKMPKNDQVDILNSFRSLKTTNAVLQEMPTQEAHDTRQLMNYAEDTAGGIMSTEFLSYSEQFTIQEVIDDLQKNSKEYSDYDVQYIYVVNETNQLLGVLRLRDLLLSNWKKKTSEMMLINPLSVDVNLHLDQLIDLFEEHGYLGIPVVDENKKLMGITRRYEVMEASEEREKDTYLKSSGIIGGEELRTMPILVRCKRRLSWLSVNIVLNILAASVIAFYQDTLSAVIALAVFLPIISDMSGCSGNQSVAVSIRELTTGVTKPSDVFSVVFKECGLGLINGLVLGILLGCVAYLWKGNIFLGIVVGAALTLNTVVAVCIGSAIPLILHKLKKDPALASSPILTTVTDMCGFFFALGLATLLLGHLTLN